MNRWQGFLDPNIASTAGRTGKWGEDEDVKLKGAIQTHGDKDWDAITALVPGRTKHQCHNRWYTILAWTNIDPTTARAGRWTPDEDSKLKDAVQRHGGKDWAAITALVPGRTQKQCSSRWHHVLNPSITLTAGRTGIWTPDEDDKLKVAVQTHGGKNWGAIAVLVPGRTKQQCRNRWNNALDPSMDRAKGRTGKWAEDEDSKLKNAVQMHGNKNWAAIVALVPGRTKVQCQNRLQTWRRSPEQE
jgi:hypothetical protein